MGIRNSIHRLPLDAALDWLTVRDVWDARTRYDEPLHYYSDPLPDEPPHVLELGHVSSDVLDLMTGTYCGPPNSIGKTFATVERGDPGWEDPRAWAALGARLVGWPPEGELPHDVDEWGRPVIKTDQFRIRYTLPQEIEAICDVLAQMTQEQMIEQGMKILKEGTTEEALRHQAEAGYKRPSYEVMKEQVPEVAKNLLLNFRQFYEAARTEGEIVIHDMR